MLKVWFADVARNYCYLYSWDIGNSLFRKGLIVGNRIIVYYSSFLLILLTFQGFESLFSKGYDYYRIFIIYLFIDF